MALQAGGKYYCKLSHTENGKPFGRRIHKMNIQAADGRLYTIEGKDLPDEISTYAGVSYRGAHVAEVLLSPGTSKATPSPILPEATGWICKRDVCFLLIGMFLFGLIYSLSEQAAISMS